MDLRSGHGGRAETALDKRPADGSICAMPHRNMGVDTR